MDTAGTWAAAGSDSAGSFCFFAFLKWGSPARVTAPGASGLFISEAAELRDGSVVDR